MHKEERIGGLVAWNKRKERKGETQPRDDNVKLCMGAFIYEILHSHILRKCKRKINVNGSGKEEQGQ